MALDKKKLVINSNWCKACGICVAFCPKNVLEIRDNLVNIKNIQNCIKCGLCELRCPDYAIYLEDTLCEGDKIHA
ncbi:4Fe-4S dicluster domain-containing protein [Tepidibacter thalassicus]|uniref:2-oxoglutarate ferredoxin oxidoreductase subunit delta n=1 Tax=Tepidibacter thalassicus DSM 15285 TaxID=1123350 RepID=A0A1M5THC6_9FIRM|nr:4Fe-4S binding protein [Tepidibacter thalassicus]SHH50126.1 2-oxoglutarate ferredoxin oxidoreductase subunit delta [Tepidibacter thalassicus DSM 15285]